MIESIPPFLIDALTLVLALACIICFLFGVIFGLFYSQTAIAGNGLPLLLQISGLFALVLIPQSVLERSDTTASHVWRIFVLGNALAFTLGTFIGYLPAWYQKKTNGA